LFAATGDANPEQQPRPPEARAQQFEELRRELCTPPGVHDVGSRIDEMRNSLGSSSAKTCSQLHVTPPGPAIGVHAVAVFRKRRAPQVCRSGERRGAPTQKTRPADRQHRDSDGSLDNMKFSGACNSRRHGAHEMARASLSPASLAPCVVIRASRSCGGAVPGSAKGRGFNGRRVRLRSARGRRNLPRAGTLTSSSYRGACTDQLRL
jgi:hypothetical protein